GLMLVGAWLVVRVVKWLVAWLVRELLGGWLWAKLLSRGGCYQLEGAAIVGLVGRVGVYLSGYVKGCCQLEAAVMGFYKLDMQ
ncbi:hypothetical protein U1Q18_030871, partial [Sarracenia purpurea var. burkii]